MHMLPGEGQGWLRCFKARRYVRRRVASTHIPNTNLDNHMINGTELLNVAGITSGLTDEILTREKTKLIVKIGPRHLRGVW